jgi:hypothetical protein
MIEISTASPVDSGKRLVHLCAENVSRRQRMDERKIVRTNRAGVFFGKVEKRDGSTVVLSNARRLWYWEGAASLSELAQFGTANAGGCKFPCSVNEVELFDVLEIISVTDEAAASIDKVKEWKRR